MVLYLFAAHSSAGIPGTSTATDDIMNLLKTQITNSAASRDKTSKVTATVTSSNLVYLCVVWVCMHCIYNVCMSSTRGVWYVCQCL